LLFKGDLPQQSAPDIEEAVEVREKEDYKLSKDEVPNSANREAGETQQRQVTETIKRYAKINRNDTVTIQNVANGQTQEMKYKKAESNR
jgi:preprotein translocase subunit SecA